ncbi:MAG TPA: glycosyltransferase family 2 protein [Rhizomicrobium sp.]|jgi:glycosyltransferase involved in cell wall biosynthesis|nr:glycosyltransferase family 2 protein [Rhizomicrobium sp.]
MAETFPLVSVVTPAYNEEEHLGQCIESVLAQSYANWELIVVDNCSTDRTREIAQGYAARDRRIRVFANETFVSALANHNIALSLISPESRYCKVLGADDFIYPECLAKMTAIGERHPSVGVIGAYRVAEQRVLIEGPPYPVEAITGRDICRTYLLGGPYPFASPSSLLYRSDAVRARPTFFVEPYMHADARVCLDILRDSDFGFVHEILSFVRVREESLHGHTRRNSLYTYARMENVKSFGGYFLSESELRETLRKLLATYYEMLGSRYYDEKDPEFWNIHKARLAELGFPLNRLRLAVYGWTGAVESLARRARRKIYGWPMP